MIDLQSRPAGVQVSSGSAQASQDLTLLVMEYEGTSGESDSVNRAPVHRLDVQVAMFDGVNTHLGRWSNPHLHHAAMRPGGSGIPLVPYDSDAMIEIVTAAWQQDDMADDSRVFSDITEQNIMSADNTKILGTVYAITADISLTPGMPSRIIPGSVGKADPALIPGNIMAAQRQACSAAWVKETAAHDVEVASAARTLADRERNLGREPVSAQASAQEQRSAPAPTQYGPEL